MIHLVNLISRFINNKKVKYVYIIYILIFTNFCFSQDTSKTSDNKPAREDVTASSLKGIGAEFGRIDPGGDPKPAYGYLFFTDLIPISDSHLYFGFMLYYYNSKTRSYISEGSSTGLILGPQLKLYFSKTTRFKPFAGTALNLGFFNRDNKLTVELPNSIKSTSRSKTYLGIDLFAGLNTSISSNFGINFEARLHMHGFDFYMGPLYTIGAFSGVEYYFNN